MKKVLLFFGAVAAAVLTVIFIVMGVENQAISYEESIENTAGNIRVEEKMTL